MPATSLSTSGVTGHGGFLMLSFDSIKCLRCARHPENFNPGLMNFHERQPRLSSIFRAKWKTKCFVAHLRATNWSRATPSVFLDSMAQELTRFGL
jgi:hypothetical protein